MLPMFSDCTSSCHTDEQIPLENTALEFVASQNGIVTGFKKAYRLSPNTIYLEANSQIYNASFAENVKVASVFDLNGDKLVLHTCPITPEEHIHVTRGKYKVTINEKNFTITVHDDKNFQIKKLIKLQDVAKIVYSREVGSIDYCPEKGLLLLTVVMKDKDKDGEKYSNSKYTFKDNLGEAMDDIEDDIKILLVDTETGKIKRLESSMNVIKAGIAADGSIYFSALDRAKPRNTGIIYCTNKPIGLYKYSEGKLTPICTNASCRSITFSQDRQKFVYLKCSLGGPHFQPSQLVLFDIQSEQERIIVPEIFIGGVFDSNIPEQQWTTCINVTVEDKFYSKIVRINLDDGTTEDISAKNESWSIVSVLEDDVIVAQYSSILHPPTLGVYKERKLILRQNNVVENQGKVVLIQIHQYCEALLIYPDNEGLKKDNVIMMPHGGPNANYLDEYIPYVASLLKAGYALCRINYTGSYAYGKKSLDLLIKEGKVGVTDVADCMLVHKELTSIGFKAVHIFGGSHGGYLAACLSSAYPAAFKSCVMINPVITLYANCVASDIFDHVYENFGMNYSDFRPPTLKELELFHERSPKPTKSNPPTLIIIGGKDQRVPSFNGKSWYGWLRGLGVVSDCLYFPDNNHSVSKPVANRNWQVAAIEFLQQYSQ